MKTLWEAGKLGVNKFNSVHKHRMSALSVNVDPADIMATKIQELAAKTPVARQQPSKIQEILTPPEVSQSTIQWPSDQKLQEVSKRLLMIKKMGIQCEVDGDHFNSGDLAYQLHEVIRSAHELFQKVQRIKKPMPV